MAKMMFKRNKYFTDDKEICIVMEILNEDGANHSFVENTQFP